MKQILLKTAAIWLSFNMIMLCLIYGIRGESIALLLLDVRYSFSRISVTGKAVLAATLVISLFCLYVIMNGYGILKLRWDICIGKKKVRAGELKFLYSHMNGITGISVAFAVLLIGIAVIFGGRNKTQVDTSWENYPIAHAMGSIDGITYTNSLDAFNRNYELGHRVFEVDFSYTSDKKLVLRHDWKKEFQTGIDEEHIPTQEGFLNVALLEKYTPLSLEDLFDLMKNYEDIWVVTDTKCEEKEAVTEQFQIILDTAREMEAEEVLNRMIVQIYNEDMLDRIKEVYDFPSVIFTMYHRWTGDAEEFSGILRFCKKNHISYITMPTKFATPEILEMADDFDVRIFVHTVNDLEVAKELMEQGVKGVYTDDLSPDMF